MLNVIYVEKLKQFVIGHIEKVLKNMDIILV